MIIKKIKKIIHSNGFFFNLLENVFYFFASDYRKPKIVLRKKILKELRHIPKKERTQEQVEVLNYLKTNPLYIFPYSFESKYYWYNEVEYFRDESRQMYYVLFEGKKMYFPAEFPEWKITRYYNSVLLEQDLRSPHRYLTDRFCVKQGDVVADIGAAEGIFALSVVEQAAKIYLFETDEMWIDALQATFEPWKDKVEIVNKYVSDVDNEKEITLDAFFKDKEHVDLIKADIEGAEKKLVDGAKNILAQNGIKIALCTYHYREDAEILEQKLKTMNFETEFSHGYIVFFDYDALQPPYLRKTLIRGYK